MVNEVQEERRYCNSMRPREPERERERERERARTIDNRKYALIFDAGARHAHAPPTNNPVSCVADE